MLLGVPEAVIIKCQAKALCTMRYAVKHVYGTASQKYNRAMVRAKAAALPLQSGRVWS